MKAIMLREIQSYYNTMIGYIFTAICLLVGGVLFTSSNIQGGSASISSVIASMSYVLILIIPLLTMPVRGGEKEQIRPVLLTAPVSITKIVTGKFLSAMVCCS
jgi:ABC-2 type transport system permease protein